MPTKNLPTTVDRIAAVVGGTVEGDGSRLIRGVAAMDVAGPDEITYASDDRRAMQLIHSKAGAAIVAKAPALPRCRSSVLTTRTPPSPNCWHIWPSLKTFRQASTPQPSYRPTP